MSSVRVAAMLSLLFISFLLLVDHVQQIEHRRLMNGLSKCITQTQCDSLDVQRIVLETKLLRKK